MSLQCGGSCMRMAISLDYRTVAMSLFWGRRGGSFMCPRIHGDGGRRRHIHPRTLQGRVLWGAPQPTTARIARPVWIWREFLIVPPHSKDGSRGF